MPPRRQTFSADELAQFISQGVAEALAALEAQRNNGSNPPHDGEDASQNLPPVKPCTYKDFLSCKPLYFKGTEGAIGLVRWIERMESVFNLCNCPENNKVKFAAYTFQEGVLTWWNAHVSSVGIEASNKIPWTTLKEMLKEEYCPNEELQKLEEEFWNLRVQDTDIAAYTTKFQQLALLCPSMVDTEQKRIKRYIRGLPETIQGNVASSKPTTIQSAIRLAHELMAMVVSREASVTSSNTKRKFEGNSNPPSNPSANKKPATAKTHTTGSDNTKSYKGSRPYCSKCSLHHDGSCPCTKCRKFGHLAKDCKSTATGTNTAKTNTTAPNTCYACGETGHFRKDCPKLKNNLAKGRFYVLRHFDDGPDPNTNAGTSIR